MRQAKLFAVDVRVVGHSTALLVIAKFCSIGRTCKVFLTAAEHSLHVRG